jgi:alkanesulfonate monooxygenase SsuD/methylene tetrahydromethanopterin reductase-like flavin-dependent oxidoreductase (luciferase family)
MEFYCFHLMPWPYLPPDFIEKNSASWVTYSNKNFDPVKAQALYNRYLDELEHAEELGFDGICVNEHHQTAYGLMPAPNIIASMLARRTKRAKIAILGNALSLRDHPLRVAEEVAMLDVITGGRIISGFVRGIGLEYYSFSLDPSRSRDRFVEALDLIIKAWTEPGPFEWHGKEFQLRYVNPWPRPLQQPHPPIWLPSTGSQETIELCVDRGYPFIRVYERADMVKQIFDNLRAEGERVGKPVPPENIGWMTPIYVAETDAKAFEEAGKHVLYLFRELSHRPMEMLVPPGYMSARSMGFALSRRERRQAIGQATAEELADLGYIVFGSPETVRQRLVEHQKNMGFGKLVGLMHFGSLPADLTRKSMDLFGSEVMPKLRAA